MINCRPTTTIGDEIPDEYDDDDDGDDPFASPTSSKQISSKRSNVFNLFSLTKLQKMHHVSLMQVHRIKLTSFLLT